MTSSNGIRNDPTPLSVNVTEAPAEPPPTAAPPPTEAQGPAAVTDAYVGTQPPAAGTPTERPNPTAAEQALQTPGAVQGPTGQGRLEPGRSQMVEVLPTDRTITDVVTRHLGYTPNAAYTRIVMQMNPARPDGQLPPHLTLPTPERMLERASFSAEQREVLRTEASKYDFIVPAAGQSWHELVRAQLPGAASLDEDALNLLVEMLQTANPSRLGGDMPPAIVAVPKSDGLGEWVRVVRESELHRRARPRTTTDDQRRMVRRVGGDIDNLSTAPTAGATFALQPNSVTRDVVLQAYRERITRQGLTGAAADREFARIAYAVLAANDLTPGQMASPERLYLPSEEQLDAILANFDERDSAGRDGFARLDALRQQPAQRRSAEQWAQLVAWSRIQTWATGTEARIGQLETALANGADPATLSAVDREAALAALESYAHQLAQIEAARNPIVIGIPGLFGFDISKFIAAARVYTATHGEDVRRDGESVVDFALRTSRLSTPEELELLKLEVTAAQQRLGPRYDAVMNFLRTAQVDSAYGSVDALRGRVTLRLEVDGQRLTPDQAIAALFPEAKVPYDLRQILLAEAALAGDKTFMTVDAPVALNQMERTSEVSSPTNTHLSHHEAAEAQRRLAMMKEAPQRVAIDTALPLDTPVEDIAKHLTRVTERAVRLDRFTAEQRAAVRKQINEFAAAIDRYRTDARTFHDKIMLTGQFLIQQLQSGRPTGGPLPSFLAPRH